MKSRSKLPSFELHGHLLVSSKLLQHQTCIYTLTPDEHFIVDRHPRHPQVAFAAGLSGHGFKFSAVLGQLLAELGPGAEPSLPVSFLSLDRPALRAAGAGSG